jgi:hypothetical protein
LPRRPAPAVGRAESVPAIDRSDRRGEVEQLLFRERRARLRIDFVADAFAQQRQRFGPGQRRPLALGELRRLAPDHDEIELVDWHVQLLGLQDVILHAECASVDLRGAQLDEFEQLLLDARLGSGVAERRDDLVNIGRQRLEIGVLAAGV